MKNMVCKFVAVSVVLPLALIGATRSRGQLTPGEKDTIFIGEMKVEPSVKARAVQDGKQLELDRVAGALDSQFNHSVSATRVFQLVERKRLQDLNLEQSFAAVSVDPNDKNAAQALKMSGARYAFLPEIDGFQDRTAVDEYQAIGRESMTRQLFLSAAVRIVDTTTGQLLPDVPSVQLNKVETVAMAGLGEAKGSDQVLVEMAREMASRLSQEVVELLRPAKVLVVTGKQVMINRGSEGGYDKGAQVGIYATQEVVDDDTGEVFRNEIPVGQARIERADSKKSFAVITGDDMGVAKGCVVKLIGGGATARTIPPATWSGGKLEDGEKTAPVSVSPDTPGSGEKPLDWGN